MSKHYLPEKWIGLARETMKSNARKEELEMFLQRTAEERNQVKELG